VGRPHFSGVLGGTDEVQVITIMVKRAIQLQLVASKEVSRSSDHKIIEGDLRKIHTEVNQLLNQRFLITSAAITVFAVFNAWIIPREPSFVGKEIGGFRFAISIIIFVILLIMFL